MKLQLPTADIKAALGAAMAGALSSEQQLGSDARAEINRLIDELYPLVAAQTQSLLTAKNPAVPQAYLGVLQGCVDAAIARLGLRAIERQRQVLANALQTGIQILALVLKAVVV